MLTYFSNTDAGERTGAEVVQVYVGIKESAVDRQKKLLKGFEKVFLEDGQSTAVSIGVELVDLRYFSNDQRKWVFEPGTYLFYIGSSSDDATLHVKEVERAWETRSTRRGAMGQVRFVGKETSPLRTQFAFAENNDYNLANGCKMQPSEATVW